MGQYTLVMLGTKSPSAESVRKAAELFDCELAVGDSSSKLMLFDPDAILVELESRESLKLVDRLVSRRSDDRVPIIAIVPHDANGLLQEARNRGADDFLTSPVHPISAATALEARCRLSLIERDLDINARPTMTYEPDVGEWMSLVSSAPNVILRVDRKGRVEFANRPLVPGQEPAGKHLSELGIPSLGDEFFRTFEYTVEKGQPTFASTSGVHPKLGHRDFMLYLGPIVGAGKVVGVAVVIADVTEQRDAERALSENHRQLVAIMEAAPDFVGIVERDGSLVFHNRATMGLTPEALEEGSLVDVLDRRFRDPFRTALTEAFTSDRPRSATYRVGQRWFDARLRRVDYQGKERVLVFSCDVTRRVETEAALRQSVRRIEVLQEQLPIAFFEMDLEWIDGKFRVSALQSSGRIAERALPERAEDFDLDAHMAGIHPDDRERVIESWQRFAAGQVDEWVHEYRVGFGTGDERWVMGRGVRIGKNRVLGFALDISDRKDLEAKLVQAQKLEAIGRLAGGVAHDFNNLLTSIVNFTWYVRDELPAESPLREDLGEVLKAAESGARLTSQLLAFSRRKPAEPTVVELNERIDQVHRVLERTIGENIDLVFHRSPAPLPVVVDPGQLDQLIFNLAVNARDAMPEGGALVVTLRRVGDMGVIEVSDTGMGIPREIQDRLFEPFFSTKGENGTGLGLATCYGIAKQAGGDIVVHSIPGAGATFEVHLPLAAREDLPLDERPVTATRLKPIPVAIVVEDQAPILKLVHRALEHAGWDVRPAGSAEEALEIARGLERPPAVLLTDVVLPKKSGVDLAHDLRALWPDLPVLLTSGYLGDEYEPAMATGGRTAFLPKPFNSVQLLTRLSLLLDD